MTSAKTKNLKTVASALDPRWRLIVALDVETVDEARRTVDEIGELAGALKIGLQLFTSGGASFVRETVEKGIKVFLDLKFHDIPNTVAKASVEAARLGVWMFNVHASGGAEMMRRTVGEVAEFCAKTDIVKPKIIAVTVLTSADRAALREVGIEREVDFQVVNLARLAAKCGLDGVVASPHETSVIRENLENPNFIVVTPGIRPVFATNDDQKRVMTPQQAVAAGADYIVVGRPVLQAKNKTKAIESILAEIG
jgi:orotidine-5'-phosphate decarboxylase